MGAFLHAVAVFFDHLADVKWQALGLAIGCHVVKLLFRARAWQNIVRAAYPGGRLRFRTAAGAYVAGVGVNSIVPARGGDLVKLYLVRHRMPESTYPTLGATLVVETIFDFFVSGALLIWVLSIGVLPTHQVYSRIPAVDWKFFLRHERWTLIGLGVLTVLAVIGFFWARLRVEKFWSRVRLGFVILRDPPAFHRRGAGAADDLLGVPDRLALLLPGGVRCPRVDSQRAARTGRRLAGDPLPGDARRRGDEAGADRLPLPRPGCLACRSCSHSASACTSR